MRERQQLTENLAKAQQVLADAEARGDTATIAQAKTVVSDLQKQLTALDQVAAKHRAIAHDIPSIYADMIDAMVKATREIVGDHKRSLSAPCFRQMLLFSRCQRLGRPKFRKL